MKFYIWKAGLTIPVTASWLCPIQHCPSSTPVTHKKIKTADIRCVCVEVKKKKYKPTTLHPDSVYSHRCWTLWNYCKWAFLHSSLSNFALSVESFVLDCVDLEALLLDRSNQLTNIIQSSKKKKKECLVKKKKTLKKYALLFSDVANFCNTLITHNPFLHYECKHALKTTRGPKTPKKWPLLRLAPSDRHTQRI